MVNTETGLDVKTFAKLMSEVSPDKRRQGHTPDYGNYRLFQLIVNRLALERVRRSLSFLMSKYTHEFKFKTGYFADDSWQRERDNHFSKPVKNLIVRLTQPFAESLREAQEAGDINPSIDREKLAESILNYFECALMRMKTSKSTEPLSLLLYTVFEVLLKK